MTTLVATIRGYEKDSIMDPLKQVNNLLTIREYLKDEKQSLDVRLTSLHALRRIFIEYIDAGRMTLVLGSGASSSGAGVDAAKEQKLREYKSWLQQQLTSYLDTLFSFISSGQESFIAPSVRTVLLLVSREYFLSNSLPSSTSSSGGHESQPLAAKFGFKTFSSLMLAFLESEPEIDVDVMLMLREEVFSKGDCSYYALRIVRSHLRELKSQLASATAGGNGFAVVSGGKAPKRPRGSGQGKGETSLVHQRAERVVRNSLDLLRVLAVPEEIDATKFLVSGVSGAAGQKLASGTEGGKELSSDSSESDSGSEGYDDDNDDNGKKHKVPDKRSKAAAAAAAAAPKRRRASQASSSEQLVDRAAHQKVFSKAWLALLSLPSSLLSSTQHKAVLRHLPDHVMGDMTNALLLADYLSGAYARGGLLAVLALEGLFQLIVRFNLDYPNFFASLYRLLSADTLCAKHRVTFMRLLSSSLRSTNLPAYLVAAFAKRLSFLSLHTPAPAAMFCVAQVTWLLRQHPTMLPLLHRDGKSVASGAGAGAGAGAAFDIRETNSLESANAQGSSLWELEGLLHHHVHSVATLAARLQNAASTNQDSRDAMPMRVEEHLEHSYAVMGEAELAGARKRSALASRAPAVLLPEGDPVSLCFG